MMPAARYFSSPSALAIADFGAYWTAKSPTPGTGLATIAALTALVDTSPFIQVNAPAAKSTYLDYLKLTCRVPGTGSTALEFAVKTDNGKAAPAGGTPITPVNVRSGGAAAQSSVWAGALVAAAAVAAKLQTSQLLRPVIPVLGDVYLIKFSAPDFAVPGQPASGAVSFDDYVPAPTVIIDPGMTGQIHIWSPGQSVAAQFEVELGLFEF